ncbi:MAG: SH3 domain-containing protein, partial [Actinobacteria bacterium]|nr:SH3 domain-containing protein [Actinomycetota bacterium]
VSEEEMVENLLSGINVQRTASQLARLAFSRDSSDNATLVAWRYAPAGQPVRKDVKEVRVRARRARTADVLVVALLVLVLAGIFAVGFAFGWKITDAFRKPAKESNKTTETKTAESSATENTEEKKAEEQSAAQPPQPVTQTATVTAQSARIRSTANPSGQILGTLQKGQQVTVLGDATGTDGKAWIKAKATVKSGNTSTEVEGFIRKDLVQLATPTTSATSPAGSATTL